MRVYKYGWVGLALVATTGVSLLLAGGQRPPKEVVVATETGQLVIDASSPAPGELAVEATFKRTNRFRDAFYVYALSVSTEEGQIIWEETVNKLQGQVKDKPATITLDRKTLHFPAGVYRAHVEVREDADELDFEGNLKSPYHVVGRRSSSLVTVR